MWQQYARAQDEREALSAQTESPQARHARLSQSPNVWDNYVACCEDRDRLYEETSRQQGTDSLSVMKAQAQSGSWGAQYQLDINGQTW